MLKQIDQNAFVYFLLHKNTEIFLIFECQNVTFLQCLQSPVAYIASKLILFHLFDMIFRI